MTKQVQLKLKNGETLQVEKGTTLYEMTKMLQTPIPFVVARINNVLKELYTKIEEDITDVEFIDLAQKDGIRVYQRTATFLLVVAAKELFPKVNVIVNHHIGGGYFCEFDRSVTCTPVHIQMIEDKMREMATQELPITKETMLVDDALKLFEETGMTDKRELFKYRRTSTINLYTLDGFKNYFYGYMIPSIKDIKSFKLIPYAHGFVLQFPCEKNPTVLAEFKPQPKLSGVFRESEHWARIIGVDLVSNLNTTIANGGLDDLIRITEALHEKKIAHIADQICEKEKVRLVLIAGPSSSGKTTFAQRLCIQLRVNGSKPHALSIDDYFVDREFTPVDEFGECDFEAIEAIDIKLFNEHVARLIQGERVEIPSFNFKHGRREYKGHYIQLKEDDVLVVEGIHGLNEKLSYAIPKENKFKIYISALTQLNIDYHNRIPTTDTRLIRRMIRDNQYRGISAEKTLELWPSVRRGENKNIFPFQEEADVMFNSILIYELAVLKQKAEPLLFSIERDSPYYSEAKRLLKFLEYFLPADSSSIPCNSIIREFVGGSCFH
ncbi:MAG: nucleoside kinase [Cellulosilyticaceae bacterium]